MLGGIKDRIIERMDEKDISFEEAEQECIDEDASAADRMCDLVRDGHLEII